MLGLFGGLLLGGAWFGLSQLRMAKVDYVANGNPSCASIAGHVRDAEGKPVAGVEVTWFAATGDRGLLGSQAFQGGSLHTTTDAEGAYRFAAVPDTEGHADLDDRNRQFEGSSKHVRPRPGFTATDLVVVAEPIHSARRLHGQLRTTAGAPVAFAPILARSDGFWRTWQCMSVTDAEGRFELVGPTPRGTADLSLTAAEGPPVELGTFAFGGQLQLTVPPGR